MKVLIAVASAGSLTAGARAAGMSQPAASRLIQRVEREIGAPVFTRAVGGVELTAQGKVLLEFATRTVSDFEAMTRRFVSPGRALKGRLRIISSTTPGEYLVPEFVSGFNRLHREVAAEVYVTDSGIVLDELLERRWDLGFVGRKTEHRSLVYRSIGWDEIVLAVPARHRFARSGVVALSELAGESFIDREAGSGTRSSVLDAFERLGLPAPVWHVAMVLSSTHAVVSAVDSGLGVGFVTSRALERHAASRLSAVRISDVPLTRLLYMVRRRSQPSQVAREFERFVTGSVPADAGAADGAAPRRPGASASRLSRASGRRRS